jgi:hypothetical protein
MTVHAAVLHAMHVCSKCHAGLTALSAVSERKAENRAQPCAEPGGLVRDGRLHGDRWRHVRIGDMGRYTILGCSFVKHRKLNLTDDAIEIEGESDVLQC